MRSHWLLALACLAGCQLEVDFGSTRYFCGDGEMCPSGQSCVADYCRVDLLPTPDAMESADADPFEPDADPLEPDAAPPIDARPGQPDAAEIIDATPPPIDATPPPIDATPPPPVCELGNIADDFASSAIAPFWDPFNELPTTSIETGGRLVVTLPSNTAGSHFAGYVYDANAESEGQRVEVDVVGVQNQSQNGVAFFKLQNGSNFNNQATFILEQGGLYMDTHNAAGTRVSRKMIVYSPISHRYWALEVTGGSVKFQTSPDGSSWTTRETQPLPFATANARVALGAGTYKEESAPGTVQFNRLGSGPSTNCFGVQQ